VAHDVEVVTDDHTGLGTQPVADPAKADLFDLSHAECQCNGGFSESGEFRVDGVNEASINAHSGGPEDSRIATVMARPMAHAHHRRS
jgi:hypothetical protein